MAAAAHFDCCARKCCTISQPVEHPLVRADEVPRRLAEDGAPAILHSGYPFLDLPNVIGSPHNSAGGGAWRDEYLRRAVQNCRRAILGETPWNLIGSDERML